MLLTYRRELVSTEQLRDVLSHQPELDSKNLVNLTVTELTKMAWRAMLNRRIVGRLAIRLLADEGLDLHGTPECRETLRPRQEASN